MSQHSSSSSLSSDAISRRTFSNVSDLPKSSTTSISSSYPHPFNDLHSPTDISGFNVHTLVRPESGNSSKNASRDLDLNDPNRKKYAIATLLSISAQNDPEIDDALTKGNNLIRKVKMGDFAALKKYRGRCTNIIYKLNY